MDKTSRIGEVWDMVGDDVCHWKITGRRPDAWDAECVKAGAGIPLGAKGLIVECWLRQKQAKQVRAVPAPAPASGVEVTVGSWWRKRSKDYAGAPPDVTHKRVVKVVPDDGGCNVVMSDYYRSDGSLSESCVGASMDLHMRAWEPIPAPPWAKQEAAKPGAIVEVKGAAEDVVGRYVAASCDHCHTTGPTAERILDRAGTRRRLCDPCYVARERVTFPAGAPVEGPRQTTWAPGTGPGSVVRPWAGTVAVPGWDKRGRR